MSKAVGAVQTGKTPVERIESGAPGADELVARFERDVFDDFDFNDPAFNTQINDVLDTQLAHCPAVRSQVGEGYWWFTRHEDIKRIGLDWQTFSSAKGYQPNRMDGMPWIYPVEMDPPQQTAWRKVLNPFLLPAAVKAFEPAIRADVVALIDRFIERGHCEFIAEFGVLLPGWAFFKNSLGVPVEMLEELLHTIERSLFGPLDERVDQLKRSFEMLEAYLHQRIKEPARGDMIDTILAGVTYPDGTPASWEHKVGITADMAVAGIGTTTFVMGSALHHLATHDDDRQLLIDDPKLIDNAVEEFVRFFPPVIGLGRYCTRDVEVAGATMKQGDFALLAYAAASRDPRVVKNPQSIDLRRKRLVHSSFGVGPHYCIGANLARAELRLLIEEWLRRIPEFKVTPGTEPGFETSQLRQMTSLHLSW